MRIKQIILRGLIFIFFIGCLNISVAFAERPETGLGKWLQEVGVFTGFATGKLKRKGNMDIYPVGVRFGFDLKPFIKKLGLTPKGLLELMYEPFVGAIANPESKVEFGIPVMLKYSYPVTNKFYPFVELGIGPYYMTLKTYEQSTQYNFISQAGAGISYFLKENWAINVGYRYRHVSNGWIKEPNGGIEASEYLVGMSWYF
jgi:hypothetical protein